MPPRCISVRTAARVSALVNRLAAPAGRGRPPPPVTILCAHPGQGVSWLLRRIAARRGDVVVEDVRRAAGRFSVADGARLVVVDHADELFLDTERRPNPAAADTWAAWDAQECVENAVHRATSTDGRPARLLLCGTSCLAHRLLCGTAPSRFGSRVRWAAYSSLDVPVCPSPVPVVHLRPTDPTDTAVALRLLGKDRRSMVTDDAVAASLLCRFTGLDAHRLMQLAAKPDGSGWPARRSVSPALDVVDTAFLQACRTGTGVRASVPLPELFRVLRPDLEKLAGWMTVMPQCCAATTTVGDAFRYWLCVAHDAGSVWIHDGRVGPTCPALVPVPDADAARARADLAAHLPRLCRALSAAGFGLDG